jgi:L-cystine uptake protein TcyP (sodium:dicarboxylate symporter family)
MAPDAADDDRRETPTERLDRNWNEILQELRVTQTGVQILTGFLLTVPFQQRFEELTGTQREIYLVLVVLAAITTGLMVAPVSLHRMLFRRRAKASLVAVADRLMRVGLVCLALVVCGVVMLVFDVVTTRTTALVAALGLLALLVAGWFALPRVLLRGHRPAPAGQAGPTAG